MRLRTVIVFALVATSACAGSTDSGAVADPVAETTTEAPPPVFSENSPDDVVTPTTAATTTTPPATTTTAPPAATTTTSTTTTTMSLPPGTPAGSIDLAQDSVVLGTSVEGREIVAERHGTIGGRRVLVVGVIHGNEDAGIAVLDRLRDRSGDGTLPDDIELWLVPSMNPDGQLAQDRHNANEVDLNRNFPFEWGPIGEPGNSQYAGPGPASEPETRAMVAFITALAPDLALWYHQDANLIIPSSGRDGELRARYAELTGLPLAQCCSGGGIYTGIAATWARREALPADGVAFIVELPGGDLTAEQVEQHATAVLTISSEL